MSPGGIDYYTNIFKELSDNGIKIIADLYHYDMPVVYQDIGGWTNGSVVDAFDAYAKTCFDAFSEYVDIWIPLAAPLREVSINCLI